MRTRRRMLGFLAAVAAVAVVAAGCAGPSIDGTATKAGTSAGQAIPQPIPTIVVLDASDSMNTADAPGPRIDAAKKAVTDLAGGLPEKTQFGVVVFGSQMPATTTRQDQACTDVTTPIPLGTLDTSTIAAKLDTIAARGYTPIGNALIEAAKQLPGAATASIVLVSDGEPTCAPDPCETAKQIRSQHPSVTISAVGFRTDAAALQCVASNGGGLFVTADNAAQLSARLAAAQNSRDAATRLSTTSRGDIAIGSTLDDIRAANPSFPTSGTKQGDRTIYIWRDCTYGFDDSGRLIEIAPGDPPGSAGTTIDGVAKGTAGTRAIELYGDAWEDTNGVALFPADEKAGTAYKLGYEGGSSIKDGTVTTVTLCGCLPAKKSTSSGGPEVVTIIGVGKDGTLKPGYSVDSSSSSSFTSSTMQDCLLGLGAITPGVFWCGSTADSAVVCWDKPSASQLLCTYSPWVKELRAISYSTPPAQKPMKPQDEVRPWALELDDGSRCTARFGGAWSPGPKGYFDVYGCSEGPTNFIVIPESAGPTGLIDKSEKGWTVLGRAGQSRTETPYRVRLTKVYYSAAEQ